MKAELYTNCSLVRLPIKAGVTDYAFPQNVEWAGRKVERIALCVPSAACIDPVDGQTPVMTTSDMANCYLSLYDKDNREIMYDVSWEQLAHFNNSPLYIDAALNLSLCKLYFTSAPAADATLLMYVFYGTRTEDYFDVPRKSVTAVFPLAANEQITLQEVINTYVHALPGKICGMLFWDAENNPAYVTLRDYDLTYQMANIHTTMARPDKNAGTAEDSQAHLFLINDLDIDFDYSNIRNATNSANTQKVTFLYS